MDGRDARFHDKITGGMNRAKRQVIFYSDNHSHLAVRLLETSTSGSTSVLLRFTPTRITDQQVAVVFDQRFSEFILRLFIDVLCVVSNDRLGNSSTDGVNLSSNTSTLDANADIKVAEFVLANHKNGLENLQSHRFGLDQFNGLTIDLDQTTALLGESHGGGSLLPVKQQTNFLVRQVQRKSRDEHSS